MRVLTYIHSLVWCIFPVLGNVEKTILLAPEAISIPQQHPNLDDLNLDALSPSAWSLRRQLPAAFPSVEKSKGPEAWFLLDGLRSHQRYEIRVCWAATVGKLSSHSHETFMFRIKMEDNLKLRSQLSSKRSNRLHSL